MDRGNTMFEDSLMESGNRIKPKSKYWSFVALLLNGGALLALIIWPLLHPEALPTQMMATLMVAPSPPAPPPPLAPAPKVQIKSEMLSDELQAPSRIPKEIRRMNEAAIAPTMVGVRGMEGLGGGTPGGVGTIIDSIGTGPATVRAETPQKLTISSGVMFGNLLEKTVPQYPAIAKAARIQGRCDPESQSHQRSSYAAASSHRCGAFLALQTLSSEWRAGRSGNYNQCGL
jgi:protein TonB